MHDDVRKVVVDQAQLEGLPPDFLASHKPDAKGQVTITSDPPDTSAVLKFANSAPLRKQLFLAAHAVAFPANTEVLRGLLTAREQLAHLLGYATWADYAMADQMMGSPAKLAAFVAKVDEASREPGAREDAALLAFAREREPALQKISAQDARYWQEQYRRAKFNFDSQSVRPYFPYAAVEKGVLDTASKLFHVQIRPVAGLRTWHPSVTTYEVFDGTTKLGTIYLDMHPREGKDKWFSTQPLTAGARGRELPDGALVCNFPGGTPGDPGPDAVRGRGRVPARVRPPDAPSDRRPEPLRRPGQLQHRGGLRRSALADAGGVLPRLRRARPVRAPLSERGGAAAGAVPAHDAGRHLRARERSAAPAHLHRDVARHPPA